MLMIDYQLSSIYALQSVLYSGGKSLQDIAPAQLSSVMDSEHFPNNHWRY